MPDKLPLAFFLATPDEPVEPGDDTWQRPLPLSRHPVPAASPATDEKAVTYGDYFTAIAGFLEKEEGAKAVEHFDKAKALGFEVAPEIAREIDALR